MFDPLISGMQILIAYFYNLTNLLGYANYGFAIILVTILIKIVLYPVTVKQIKSMKIMQELAPKQKAIQEKYKGNNEKIQKELIALYAEKGGNPFSGCLPMIVQMLVLYVLFRALSNFQYQGPADFLWINHLAETDKMFIIPLLAVITTFIMQKQTSLANNNADSNSQAQQQQKMMLYIMPLVFGYMCVQFSAGIGLYYVVSNIIQIFQQWIINRKPEIDIQREAH